MKKNEKIVKTVENTKSCCFIILFYGFFEKKISIVRRTTTIFTKVTKMQNTCIKYTAHTYTHTYSNTKLISVKV